MIALGTLGLGQYSEVFMMKIMEMESELAGLYWLITLPKTNFDCTATAGGDDDDDGNPSQPSSYDIYRQRQQFRRT